MEYSNIGILWLYWLVASNAFLKRIILKIWLCGLGSIQKSIQKTSRKIFVWGILSWRILKQEMWKEMGQLVSYIIFHTIAHSKLTFFCFIISGSFAHHKEGDLKLTYMASYQIDSILHCSTICQTDENCDAFSVEKQDLKMRCSTWYSKPTSQQQTISPGQDLVLYKRSTPWSSHGVQ